MSLIITVYTSEGIIMASDSRTTYNSCIQMADGTTGTLLGTQIIDTTYKTFICNSHIGISTCGTANINQIPITGYIEKFISSKVDETSSVDEVSNDIINYFSNLCPNLSTNFFVSGYDKGTTIPIVNHVMVETKKIEKKDTTFSGATWDGESITLSKLFTQVGIKQQDGNYIDVPNNGIAFNYFTLQDAINFAEYAVDVTIKTMSFENCVKTVGGPIDILAIKPDKAFWIKRKELHA